MTSDKFGLPYRPPYSGWPQRRRVYLGCGNHIRSEEKAVTVMPNITRVKDYADPPNADGIAPYVRSDSLADPPPHGAWGYPPINPTSAGGGDALDPPATNPYTETDFRENDNYYDFANSTTADLHLCKKRGWKAVQAWKSWHGREQFLCFDDGCRDIEVKYRTVERSVRVKLGHYDGITLIIDAEVLYTRATTVDRWSGKLIDIVCTDDVISNEGGRDWETVNWATTIGSWPSPCTDAEELATLNYDNSNEYGFIQISTAALGENGLSYTRTFETNENDDYVSVESEGLLSDPYIKADLREDIVTLLSKWKLGNDIQYPWRLDGHETVAPVVHFDEPENGVNPDMGIFTCPHTDDSAYLGEDNIRGGAPVLQTVSQNSTTDKSFQWDHITFLRGMAGDSNTVGRHGAWSGPAGGGAGDGTDQLVPPGASVWTDNQVAGVRWPGAWLYFEGAGKDVLYAQKWAEIKVVRPSHNFFRPCGGDRWVMDPTTERCIEEWDGLELRMFDLSPDFAPGDVVVIYGGGTPLDKTAWIVDSVGGYTVTLGTQLPALTGAFDYAKRKRYPDIGSAYDCGVLAKLRWPDAWPIEGRAAVASMSLNEAETVLSVTLNDACKYIITGDRVDFTDASGTIVVSDKEITVISSTSFTIPHNEIPEGVLYVKSHGAPAWYWCDSAPKGDFVMDTYTGTFDAGGVTAADPTLDGDVTSETIGMRWRACRPSVIAITPCITGSSSGGAINPDGNLDGEDLAVSSTKDFDFVSSFECSTCGSLWLKQVRQHMDDPLWLPPAKACEESAGCLDLYTTPTEDTGLCDQSDSPTIHYYQHAPQEEAITELPSFVPSGVVGGDVATAPALPSGCSIPDAPLPTVPLWVNMGDGDFGTVAIPGSYQTPGALYGYQCLCVGNEGRFAQDYSANGVKC